MANETVKYGRDRDGSKTETRYDEFGRIVSEKVFGPADTEYRDSIFSETTYSYGANGNLESKKSAWRDGSTSEDKYNSSGNIISSTNYDSNGKPEGYSNKYNYDSNGRLDSRESYYNENGTSTISSVHKMEYDDKGNAIGQKDYKPDGTFYGEYKATYDENGNRLTLKYCDTNGNMEFGWEHEYDSKGHDVVVKELGKNGELISTDYHEYDDTGKEVAMRSYNSDGKLVHKEVEYEMTFGGKTYTFNATELRNVVGSLDSSKTKITGILNSMGSKCGTIANIVASEDSGLSGTLNNIKELCNTCSNTIDTLLSNLGESINTYVSSTLSNEEERIRELGEVDSSLEEVSNILSSIEE